MVSLCGRGEMLKGVWDLRMVIVGAAFRAVEGGILLILWPVTLLMTGGLLLPARTAHKERKEERKLTLLHASNLPGNHGPLYRTPQNTIVTNIGNVTTVV